jgi:hypothetical protein
VIADPGPHPDDAPAPREVVIDGREFVELLRLERWFASGRRWEEPARSPAHG